MWAIIIARIGVMIKRMAGKTEYYRSSIRGRLQRDLETAKS